MMVIYGNLKGWINMLKIKDNIELKELEKFGFDDEEDRYFFHHMRMEYGEQCEWKTCLHKLEKNVQRPDNRSYSQRRGAHTCVQHE